MLVLWKCNLIQLVRIFKITVCLKQDAVPFCYIKTTELCCAVLLFKGIKFVPPPHPTQSFGFVYFQKHNKIPAFLKMYLGALNQLDVLHTLRIFFCSVIHCWGGRVCVCVYSMMKTLFQSEMFIRSSSKQATWKMPWRVLRGQVLLVNKWPFILVEDQIISRY